MTDSTLKRFLVTYQIPAAVMDGWKNTDPEVRKASETKLHGEWQAWTAKHAGMIVDANGAGKTKRVTSGGVTDTRNDIVLCATIEAESLEAAAEVFKQHPHLQIPQAFIDIMYVRPMTDW